MSVPTHIITVMSNTSAQPDLSGLQTVLTEASAKIIDISQLPVPVSVGTDRHIYMVTIRTNEGELLSPALMNLADNLRIDLVCQTLEQRQTDYGLAAFDMDSTLICCEVIDELAKAAGVGDQVAAITLRAMNGDLNFDESFKARIAMLRGLSSEIVEDILEHIPIQEGLREMTTTMRARGLRLAILSGGFLPFAKRLQVEYGFDYIVSNHLDIADGLLTGRVVPPIVNNEFKAKTLIRLAKNLGIPLSSCIAVGDGANDLAMIELAGLGVAFHAKSAVQAAAPHRINHIGLDGLCYLIGDEFEATSG